MLTSTERKGNQQLLKVDSEKVDVEVTKDDVKLDVNDQNNLLVKDSQVDIQKEAIN
jgi:hypothetical protein